MVRDSVRSVSSSFVCNTLLQKNVNGGMEPRSLVTKGKTLVTKGNGMTLVTKGKPLVNKGKDLGDKRERHITLLYSGSKSILITEMVCDSVRSVNFRTSHFTSKERKWRNGTLVLGYQREDFGDQRENKRMIE